MGILDRLREAFCLLFDAPRTKEVCQDEFFVGSGGEMKRLILSRDDRWQEAQRSQKPSTTLGYNLGWNSLFSEHIYIHISISMA